MFCCGDCGRPKESYQVIRKNEENETIVSYVPDLKTLQKGVTEDKNVKIRPVRMSDYAELYEQCKNNKTQFEDISFPPDQTSLGNIGVSAHWKRISEFLNNQTLFDDKIQPNDVVHSNVGDCYLLSSIAALAENPEIIKTIYHGQEYNKEGIYRIVLSVDGIIQEVVVDDYIPLNEYDTPIFCQPTIRETTTQIWTLILEKALAKVKGSYANIMEGTPSEIFRMVTYCPAQSLVFDDNDKEKIWELMKNCSGYNEPFCATTKETLSKYSGLIPQHTYTLNAVASLNVRDMSIGDLSSQKLERVVKLRNPWAKSNDEGWKGRGGNEDRQFWDGVQPDNELNFIRKPTLCGDYGIFYMTFQDFCKNFNQIHYCNFHFNGKTVTQEFAPNNQNGNYFDIFVDHPGIYTIEVNQSTIQKQTKQQRKEEGGCRVSMILMSNSGGKCTYKGGSMKQNQEHLMLTQQLEPGHYIILIQVDPTRMTNLYPDSTNISVHSSTMVKINPAEPGKYQTSLHDAFLTDGLNNEKKMVENGGLMTISYRLLFQQGGYGYIVFHNEKASDKSFVVNYSPEQFDNAHLQVVEPAQHDKDFEMRVNPGNDMLILAKAKNQKVESWKFPPKMNVKLEPLF